MVRCSGENEANAAIATRPTFRPVLRPEFPACPVAVRRRELSAEVSRAATKKPGAGSLPPGRTIYDMTALRLCVVLLAWLVQLAIACAAPALGDPACPLVLGGSPIAFSLPDNDGVVRSPAQFAGQVLIVNHSDPEHRDTNEAVSDAVKQAVESGRLSKDKVKGLGIADCQASWLPNTFIRAFGKLKARKYGSIVLYDYTGEVRRCWGLPPRTSTIVILDKNGVCRFIASGKLDKDKIPALIDLVAALEREPLAGQTPPPGPGNVSRGRPIAPVEY